MNWLPSEGFGHSIISLDVTHTNLMIPYVSSNFMIKQDIIIINYMNIRTSWEALIFSFFDNDTAIFLKKTMAKTQSILAQCSISIPPENVRKPLVFWRFQRIKKWNTGLKWITNQTLQY